MNQQLAIVNSKQEHDSSQQTEYLFMTEQSRLDARRTTRDREQRTRCNIASIQTAQYAALNECID
ncbi:hypothetical protein [Caudoviricetes sp.]|nr:hypothetical protein [Caudoviricetes sp.]